MTEQLSEQSADLSVGFRGILTGLSEGPRTEDWAELAERLGAMISDLPARRRQALVMLLFAQSHRMVTADQAATWIATHDVDSDEGVEELIRWLRRFRPAEA